MRNGSFPQRLLALGFPFGVVLVVENRAHVLVPVHDEYRRNMGTARMEGLKGVEQWPGGSVVTKLPALPVFSTYNMS